MASGWGRAACVLKERVCRRWASRERRVVWKAW
jgi:hypothetical protein